MNSSRFAFGRLSLLTWVFATCLLSVSAAAVATDVPPAQGLQQRNQLLSQVASLSQLQFFWHYQGKWRGNADAPRLSEFLQSIPNAEQVYWPSAQLFQLDAPELASVETLRSEVAEQLRLLTLAHPDDPLLAAKLMQLRTQVQSWLLGKPLHEALEPGLAYNQAKYNPQLSAGRYVLQASARPKTLQVLGLGGVFELQFEPQQPAYEYQSSLLRQQALLPEQLQLLLPSGVVKTIPIADWNRSEQPLDITALVFVPIPDVYLTAETAQLNQQLLQLVAYRVKP